MYNLSISCIHEQNYKEAGHHIIRALAVYESNMEDLKASFGDVVGLDKNMNSDTLWNALATLVSGYSKHVITV